MTVLWTTRHPAQHHDPEPDDEDNGPWCRTAVSQEHL